VKFGKMLLACAGATVLLGTLVSVASAGNFSTSSQTLRATFASLEFSGAFGTARCPVTLEGSFHERTTAKVVGRLVGYLTRAALGACTSGSATVLTETLPWHIRYSSFAGTLPNITRASANVTGVAFRIREVGGVTCLIRSTEGEPTTVAFNREAAGALTSATAGGTTRAGAECFGAAGTFVGTSTAFTVLNNTNRITLSLI
jgi:hypothetical protein